MLNGKQKYLTLIDGPKVILNGKCTKLPSDLYKNVRTITVQPTAKNVRKISQLNGMPIKILPKPTAGDKIKPVQATLTTLKCITSKNVANSIDTLFMNVKRPQTGTVHLHKLSQLTNLNLKVSSTVVPIVKRNLPSKTNSIINNSSNTNLSTTLSVETAVPTVPVAKPRMCTVESLKTSGNIVKVNRPAHSPELKRPESIGSDSGVCSPLTVSVSGEGEPPPQKSPILSQPTTIRFPAKADEGGSENAGRRGSDAGAESCRWIGCQTMQFDTSGALLEHLQVRITL